MLTLNRDLGIQIEALEGGRRALTMDIGLGVVRAVEIPGRAMSQDEWGLIQLARDAYVRMWGGEHEVKTIGQDPFDGLEQNDPYQTFHYLGRVDIPGADSRIITMRKVSLSPTAVGEEPPPPEDVTFWLARNSETGETIPLWDMLMAAVEFPSDVAAISRTGTYPYRLRGRTPIERERNAIAFAAIQVLATEVDAHTYFICQLCQEFQNRVHSIDDGLGHRVALDFTRSEDTLDLSPEWQVRLNNHNHGVQHVKTFYPGYWVDGEDAARVMRDLLQNGALTDQDLRSAWPEIPPELATAETGNARELDELIGFLTKPKHFKYLIPVIKKHSSLHDKLIHEAASRPYSSTLVPRLWRQSALNLLSVAKEKYERMKTEALFTRELSRAEAHHQ
jgi:hypothetical protein